MKHLLVLLIITMIGSVSTNAQMLSTAGMDTAGAIGIHPQDIPEDKGFLIKSDKGKSKLRVFGSVRLFGSYDINGLAGGTNFNLGDIPVDTSTSNENTFFMTPNISRLGVEVDQYTTLGDLYMKIETDFNGSGKNFRIRHAYGQGDFLLAGQTWTTFSFVETLPITVDTEGPPTAVSPRTIQIRYFKNTKDKWRFLLSMEAPSISVDIPDTVAIEPVSQGYPAVAGSVRKTWLGLDLGLAAIFNPISVRNLDGTKSNLPGFGILSSIDVNLFKDTKIMNQTLTGAGIASFLNLSDNTAYDVILNTQNGNYEITNLYGGFVTISQDLFHRKLNVNLTFGGVHFVMEDYFSSNTFEEGFYFALNSFFTFIDKNRVGLEYTYGVKTIKSGAKGTANRIAFTFYYDF